MRDMMAMRAGGAAFLSCAKRGLRHGLADKMTMLGVFMTYAVIMLLYAGVVRLIPGADLAPFGFSHAQMIWYMGTTEFVLFIAPGWHFRELQQDIQAGRYDLALSRPAAPAQIQIGFWLGESLSRFVYMFPGYLALMAALSGTFPFDALHLLGVLAALPLAVGMMLCGSYAIGSSCLWLVQAEPAFWIWQKSVFLFGVMLWPMAFYPEWLQALVWALPFRGFLALAGEMALGLPPAHYAWAFAHQAAWAAAIFWGIGAYDRRVRARIQSGEG